MMNPFYSSQIIATNGVVLRVDLRAAMFSFPSCIAVDSSDRLFHDLLRNQAGHQGVQNYAPNQLGCGTD